MGYLHWNIVVYGVELFISVSCMKKVLFLLLFVSSFKFVLAQESAAPVSDEELKGVWVYTSFSIGEKSFDNDFLSIKIYGDDGEYCCARAQKLNCGTFRILPVDYGTYVYRNGEYTECGRKGNLNLVSATSFNGMYIGRRECWEKVVDFPAELRRYIVEECKKAVLGDAQMYQEMMEKYWINR